MNEWIDDLVDLAAAAERVVVVTVAGVRGSAPREVGAKMLVTEKETLGTIGGGQLEYECSRIAFDMLGHDEQPVVRKFPLGTAMGQCCGGVVDILFESIASGMPGWLRELSALHRGYDRHKGVVTPESVYELDDRAMKAEELDDARSSLESRRAAHQCNDWFFEPVVGNEFNIAVFGAGHVGSAVVRSLSALDCTIRWVDNRRNVFGNTPINVRTIEAVDPTLEVAALPPGSCYLVMTHSHALDFEICDRILRRGDAAYCGLIGSVTKRRRFEKRYREQGMSNAVLEHLVCPIGVDGISGKKPAEIAVAVSAEVLQAYESMCRATDIAYPDNVRPIKTTT